MAYRFSSPQMECAGITNRELARPASDLPITTLYKIGSRLQIQTQNGDWKSVAEMLGYNREAIDELQCLADASRSLPGILLLLNWSSQRNGRSIFVLRDVLHECDRHDCVDILDKSIREELVSVLLYIQVEDEGNQDLLAFHKIKTHGHATLRDCLVNLLGGEIDTFQIVQEGLSWDKTLAKDLKGQQLILRRKPTRVNAPIHVLPTSSHEPDARRSEVQMCMQNDLSMLHIPTNITEQHCNIYSSRGIPDQSNVISSSSLTDSSDSQTFPKQSNLPLHQAINKKRKLALPNPYTSTMEHKINCFDDDVVVASETLGFQQARHSVFPSETLGFQQARHSVFPSEKTATENEDTTESETTVENVFRYEPLRRFSNEKTTKVQSVSPSLSSRFFRHSHESGDTVSCPVAWGNDTYTLADILAGKTMHHGSTLIQSLPPALPSRCPNIPPRIPYINCEVLRKRKEQIQSDDNLKKFCKQLKDLAGWCPEETEDTITSSLQLVCHQDGNYIIWYMRITKKLAMSISHLKSIIHYEIHVKMDGRETTYNFYPEHKFSNLTQLIEYHRLHGLEPHCAASSLGSLSTNRSLHNITRYWHVRPKCAVRIHYSVKRYSV